MKSISEIVQKMVAPLYDKNPLLALMRDWPLIVGAEIATYTWPCKLITPPTGEPLLYVAVTASFEFQAWAESNTIIERVNQHFGSLAITRIRWTKAP